MVSMREHTEVPGGEQGLAVAQAGGLTGICKEGLGKGKK